MPSELYGRFVVATGLLAPVVRIAGTAQCVCVAAMSRSSGQCPVFIAHGHRTGQQPAVGSHLVDGSHVPVLTEQAVHG